MKFFLTIFAMSALMLTFSPQKNNQKAKKSMAMTPLKSTVINSFDHPRNASAFWAFLTGDAAQISPKLKKQFGNLKLGFLFSPSGLHLGAFLFLLTYFFKKCFSKKVSAYLRLSCYASFYLFPSYAIKRIVIMRLLFFLKQRLKKPWSFELLFFITFAISFGLGHYFDSPSGFAMSFLFMGTIIALRDHSRGRILIGLFMVHLLLSFFNGEETSPLALLLGIPLISYFSAMMSLSGIYLVSFQFLHWNWMEKLVAFFLWMIKKSSKLVIGTQVDTSLFLILGLGIILWRKDKRWLLLCFLMHTNLAHSPAYFISGVVGR